MTRASNVFTCQDILNIFFARRSSVHKRAVEFARKSSLKEYLIMTIYQRFFNNKFHFLFFSTDPFNRTAVAVITACFICFAVFIVVLILLKMARLHRKKKKQARELNSGREEMAMLPYRQKSSKIPNNNEDDGE